MLRKISDGASIKSISESGVQMKNYEKTTSSEDEWDEKTIPNADPAWWNEELGCVFDPDNPFSCAICDCALCRQALSLFEASKSADCDDYHWKKALS